MASKHASRPVGTRNNNEDIVCWKRPRKKIELDCVESFTTKYTISPRNVTSSSISAVTFDESEFKRSNLGKTNESDHHGENFELIRCTDGARQKLEGRHCLKGSLFCRITNGYNTDSLKYDEGHNVCITQGILSKPSTVVKEDCNYTNGANEKDEIVDDEYHIAQGKEVVGDERYNALEKQNTVDIVSVNASQNQLEDCPSTRSCISPKASNIYNYEGNGNSNYTSDGVQQQESSERIDEWREVKDEDTGTSYFYNRRTRESRWNLPANAILLSKSRTINSEKQQCTKAREVSMTVSEMTQSECSTDSLQSRIDFDKDVKYSPESMNPFDGSDDDETLCADTCDEHSEGSLIARWKTLKKPLQIEQRRRFFFPDKSDAEAKVEAEKSYLKNVFCMFCGEEISSTSLMILHIKNGDCQCAIALPCDHVDKVCNAIESTFRVIGRTNDIENNETNNIVPQEYDKENIPPCNRHTLEVTKISTDSQMEESVIFTNSDEEDTITDFHYTRNLSTIDRNKTSSSTGSLDYECDIESPIISRCPFCSKSFVKGSDLSKHFLTCNERRRSIKKRMKSCNDIRL